MKRVFFVPNGEVVFYDPVDIDIDAVRFECEEEFEEYVRYRRGW